MYKGNLFLLGLNLPLIELWVQILRIQYSILFPIILVFTILGCYSTNYNIFELGLFGVAGYVLRKMDFDCAPLIFGLVLSPLLENAFRQSLMMSQGSFLIFLERPVSLSLLILFALIVVGPILKRLP